MANLIPISTVVVGSGGASSIDFNNIPQGYTDLKIVCSTRSDSPNVYEYNAIRFNGNSSAIYTQRHVRGSGTTATSGTDTNATAIPPQMGTGGGATSNTFSNTEFYIPNYTSSNNKSVSIDSVGENNATAAYAGLNAAIWASSNSITSATIFPLDGPNFVQHSTATLYGIRKY